MIGNSAALRKRGEGCIPSTQKVKPLSKGEGFGERGLRVGTAMLSGGSR
jgi:hypothetical protein